MTHKYKVGDRVTWNRPQESKFYPGLVGKVVGVTWCDNYEAGVEEDLLYVEWKEDVEGHSCAGRCNDGYGWNIWISNVLPYEEPVDKEYEALLV